MPLEKGVFLTSFLGLIQENGEWPKQDVLPDGIRLGCRPNVNVASNINISSGEEAHKARSKRKPIPPRRHIFLVSTTLRIRSLETAYDRVSTQYRKFARKEFYIYGKHSN